MVSQSNDKSKAHIKRTAKKVAGMKELEEWKGATTNKKKPKTEKQMLAVWPRLKF